MLAIFTSRMLRIPGRYRLSCITLFLFMKVGFSANPADTSLVFYQDRTFNGFLDKAILYQRKADSLHHLSIDWRKEIAWIGDPTQRTAWQKRISVAEDSAAIYMEMARVHFAYVNGMVPVEKQSSPYLVKDTVLDGITVYQYRLTDDFLARLEEINGKLSETDTTLSVPSGNGSNFKIYNHSPYSTANIFEYDFPLPAGVFYRIQLAVYKTRLAPDFFRGLSPITTEKIPDRNLIRYFVGKFYRYEDARKALVKVRAYGHTDAFIIGYYNGTKGTFTKLKELERHP